MVRSGRDDSRRMASGERLAGPLGDIEMKSPSTLRTLHLWWKAEVIAGWTGSGKACSL